MNEEEYKIWEKKVKYFQSHKMKIVETVENQWFPGNRFFYNVSIYFHRYWGNYWVVERMDVGITQIEECDSIEEARKIGKQWRDEQLDWRN